MRNAIVILLLPLFVLFGCDAEQKNQATEKVQVLESTLDEVMQTEMAEPEIVESEMTEEEMVQAEAAEAERADQMEETASVEVVDEVEPMVEEAVVEEVMVEEAISGEMIYKKSCIGCHASGAANAPKLGDAAAWAPRIAKGMDALYASAMNGIPGTAMMAKGTCAACDEEELNAAVDYMVSKAK